jgi:CMP-N-acetylneuraminic acid synthetase
VNTVRHAVQAHEDMAGRGADAVVILYGNIPVRAAGVVDRCVDHLAQTGCDSVRTVALVTKQHPDWIHRLEGDRLIQFRPNTTHRRQDLEPLYYHDGAVIAVRRDCLFIPEAFENPHNFFGRDRRAVVQAPEDAVDIDTRVDLYLAEAILRARSETGEPERPTASAVGGGYGR